MTKAKNNNKAANPHGFAYKFKQIIRRMTMICRSIFKKAIGSKRQFIRKANPHGILLNPDTVLDIEKLEKERDELGFDEKVPKFVDYVKGYLENKKSLVVGIYGGYGSGKSVFVNLVNEEVKDNKTEFIKFHAWKYKDEQSIWRNFILKIVNNLYNRKLTLSYWVNVLKLNKLKKDLYYTKNSKSVDWLYVSILTLVYIILMIITSNHLDILQQSSHETTDIIKLIIICISALFLVAITIYSKNISLFLSERTKQPISSIEEFESEFWKLINDCRYDKIYVAIENIDRCLPHHSIRLLESLKSFLEDYSEDNDGKGQLKKQLIFLIPCDKEVLEIAIKKEYGDIDDFNASTYLDKLIQLPYDLPVCSDKEWKAYVKSLLNKRYLRKQLSFECLKTNKIEKRAFSEWIMDMLNFAQLTNPREIKILFREWEMRFVNLHPELKNDKDKSLKSALFLLKLLILKKKGFDDSQKGTRSVELDSSKNIYNSIELFCIYIKPVIVQKYKESIIVCKLFEPKIHNIERMMADTDSRDVFEKKMNEYKNEPYYVAMHGYMEKFLTERGMGSKIERNDFFKYTLNTRLPKYNKGAVLDFRKYNSNFLSQEDIDSIKQILNFITQDIFDGALPYVVNDLLRLKHSIHHNAKNTDQRRIQSLLLNPIRPSSFTDLKKFMLTTKSSKESKSQDIAKTNKQV